MHSLEISKGADTALQVANVLVFILKTFTFDSSVILFRSYIFGVYQENDYFWVS